jgi:hypothetical protein
VKEERKRMRRRRRKKECRKRVIVWEVRSFVVLRTARDLAAF